MVNLRYWLFFMLIIASIANSSEQQPEMELLEFLVDWQTDEGMWIDPEQLQQMPELDSDKEDTDTNEHD